MNENTNTSGMEGMESIFVQQQADWSEIITQYEIRNRYNVSNSVNDETFIVDEESNYVQTLGSFRALTLHILTPVGNPVLKAKRLFKFYFHEMQISDADGTPLGTIKKKFAIFSNQYIIEDSQGIELFKIYGPFFHPYTFNILRNDVQIGQIIKNWSGIGKELFTDADNFSATFPVDTEPANKALFLGALFLIDLVHFEQK